MNNKEFQERLGANPEPKVIELSSTKPQSNILQISKEFPQLHEGFNLKHCINNAEDLVLTVRLDNMVMRFYFTKSKKCKKRKGYIKMYFNIDGNIEGKNADGENDFYRDVFALRILVNRRTLEMSKFVKMHKPSAVRLCGHEVHKIQTNFFSIELSSKR
jgi:hypothetical protein